MERWRLMRGVGEEGKLLLNEIRTGGMRADGSSVVVMEGSGSGSGQWNGGGGLIYVTCGV